jgi:syntaxin-binding protein 5
VTHFELHGYAIVGVFGDGSTRAYSLPGLKEIGAASLPMLDKPRISSTIITPSGDIFGWTSPSEIAMLNVWGTGQPLSTSQDKLFNPEAVIPPRPTISSLQWIAGTQYVSPTDLDLLIGGPDRPPSKRMMAAAAEEARQGRGGGGPSRAATASSQEGWGEYMTRQLNERTEKLGIMGDSVERVRVVLSQWISADFVNASFRFKRIARDGLRTRVSGRTSKRGIWSWAALKASFSGNRVYGTGAFVERSC